MAESSKALMQVNIVAADHPVWHGTAKSVTIPASEGEMGILADHEPVLTVIKEARFRSWIPQASAMRSRSVTDSSPSISTSSRLPSNAAVMWSALKDPVSNSELFGTAAAVPLRSLGAVCILQAARFLCYLLGVIPRQCPAHSISSKIRVEIAEIRNSPCEIAKVFGS